MNCDEIRPSLLDYVMGEVPSQDSQAISQHLDTCSGCSEEVGGIRQTMGLMTKSVAMEEIPQQIRMVAEPSGWWSDFWLNPARLAFAGGALACLAIAMLALSRTNIDFQDGNFKIAFGAAVATDQSPAAAPASRMAAGNDSLEGGSVSREEVLALVSRAVEASEQRQLEKSASLVQTSLAAFEEQAEANRINDRRELAETFRYIQAAQVNLWKQQVENQQVVSSLLQRAGADTLSQP